MITAVVIGVVGGLLITLARYPGAFRRDPRPSTEQLMKMLEQASIGSTTHPCEQADTCVMAPKCPHYRHCETVED